MEEIQDEVLEFITRRWECCDANWMNGNCYWFAFILCERFKYLKLYYEYVIGHFLAGANGCYYDWNGKYVEIDHIIPFDELKEKDPIWANRILKNCRD